MYKIPICSHWLLTSLVNYMIKHSGGVAFITNNLTDDERKKAYSADIVYSTNNELAFDYLRDNMKFSQEDMVQRGFNYAIVDEILRFLTYLFFQTSLFLLFYFTLYYFTIFDVVMQEVYLFNQHDIP